MSEDSEFTQLSRICESAVIFEGLNIDWKRPNLERARFFDKILKNSGLEPGFCLLDDDLCLKISNQMSKFLHERLTKKEVQNLIDGRATLKAIGIEKPFIDKLNAITQDSPKPLSLGLKAKNNSHDILENGELND